MVHNVPILHISSGIMMVIMYSWKNAKSTACRDIDREYIEGAMFPGGSMRPHHAQMQKCYRGELKRAGARHPYLGKALGSFACTKNRAKHTGPPF